MCDYSLHAIRNRLAEEGEELELHRFPTGTLGFASVHDLEQIQEAEDGPRGFWNTLSTWFAPRPCTAPAVCIPPGAKLMLTEVPASHPRIPLLRPPELVTFTELSNRANTYRDAIVRSDGQSILLQRLPEGVRALVLTLAADVAEEEPMLQPVHAV